MKYIFILSVIVVLIVSGILYTLTKTKPAPTTNPSNEATSTVSIHQSGTSTVVSQKLVVLDSSGGTVSVNDFRTLQEVIVATHMPRHYFLAGGADPSAVQASYSTFYNEKDSSFNITLLTTPLGATRRDAERKLMGQLGITEADMCRLQYRVGVPAFVDRPLAGEQLGFSFCPGAVSLPE